jgi:SdpI/YfhL protein family
VVGVSIGRSNSILIAAGYAGGLAAFPWLPGPYFGPERSLVARAAIAFLIPTAAFVTCATVETLFSRTTSNAPHVESARAIRAVSAMTVLFMVGLHGLVLVSLLGFPISGFPVHRLAMVLFGLLLVGIGNVMPRVRPNTVVGIRTRPLLDDRVAWARVHRMIGYFLVMLGAIAVGVGLTLSKSQIPLVLSSAVVVGATVNLAAYQRWTRG